MQRLVGVICLLVLVAGFSADVHTDWLCDGDLLHAEALAGAVDISGLPQGIPNSSAGTLPGDGVLIHWRDLHLQLPRTNNAGAPSYTDGRWWWRVEDPDHPEFLERRGSVLTHSCVPA